MEHDLCQFAPELCARGSREPGRIHTGMRGRTVGLRTVPRHQHRKVNPALGARRQKFSISDDPNIHCCGSEISTSRRGVSAIRSGVRDRAQCVKVIPNKFLEANGNGSCHECAEVDNLIRFTIAESPNTLPWGRSSQCLLIGVGAVKIDAHTKSAAIRSLIIGQCRSRNALPRDGAIFWLRTVSTLQTRNLDSTLSASISKRVGGKTKVQGRVIMRIVESAASLLRHDSLGGVEILLH